MTKARGNNRLERWEIALVKAMVDRGDWNDQEILAYFTRPTRSINHRVISEIRNEKHHRQLRAATDDQLDGFLAIWPDVDPSTGLSVRGDELLIKAREAMIAAVHTFNGAGLTFRSELFIVTAIIAWTYLLHAWFKREGVDYRYKRPDGTVVRTKQGEDNYWELEKCLDNHRCPVGAGAKLNLKFLIGLRHEIEHRSTSRIDNAISAKLQACCINFNEVLTKEFGAQFGLERRLSIALQFATFNSDQRAALKAAGGLPQHIETMMSTFHEGLTEQQFADSAFAWRVFFVPKIAARASTGDEAIEFVKPGSDEEIEVNRVLLKEVDKRRHTASDIVNLIQREGYRRFTMRSHSDLWQELDAKNPANGYGRVGDYRNTWVWFDRWLDRVRVHCEEHAAKYR